MAARRGYRVSDRGALREVVARIVEVSGGQAKAAAALRIGQPQVSKMLNERVGALTDRTFDRLARRCPPDVAPRLQAAVLDRTGVLAIKRYQAWLRDQLSDYGLRANEPLVESFHRPDQAARLAALVPIVATAPTRGDLNPPWPTRADHLVSVLLGNHDYGKRLHDFTELVRRRLGSSPETEIRIRLSLCRVVAPLVVGWDTWRIERTAEELHEAGGRGRQVPGQAHPRPTELGTYLKHALAAEEILLKREPYFTRAQSARVPDPGANRLGTD